MTDLEMDLMLANARIKQLERELAEATPEKRSPKAAANVITEHCKMQQGCDECIFYTKKQDGCFFAFSNLPCDWAFGGDINGH